MLTEVRETTSRALPVGDGREGTVLEAPVDRSLERTPEQHVAHAAVVGAAVGVAVAIPLFFVVGIITGAGVGPAVLLALFCAFWGGLGLGGMAGAVAGFAKEERREAQLAGERRSAVAGAPTRR
jgi:hypothetical protein